MGWLKAAVNDCKNPWLALPLTFLTNHSIHLCLSFSLTKWKKWSLLSLSYFFNFLSHCNPLRVRSYYLQCVCSEPKISNSEYNSWLWIASVFKLTFSSRCLERFFSFSQTEISANHHHASSHLPAVYLPLLRINLALEHFTNSLVDFHKYQLHLNNGLINTALRFKMSCMKNRWSLHVLHSCYSDAKYVTENNHMLFARVSKEFDNDN